METGAITKTIEDLINWIGKTPAEAVPSQIRNKLVSVSDQVEALEAAYARLKNENAVLKNTAEQQISDLRKVNEELVSANQKLVTECQSKKSDESDKLSGDAFKVLEFFFTHNEVSIDEIERTIQLEDGMVKYHLNELKERKFVFQSLARAVGRIQMNRYKITHAGQTFVMANRKPR